MASESSANAGSNVARGNASAFGPVLALADSRKEEREDGRNGVVGRDVLERDVDRPRALLWGSLDMMGDAGVPRWLGLAGAVFVVSRLAAADEPSSLSLIDQCRGRLLIRYWSML